MGFPEAHAAIDAGDVDGLRRQLDADPALVHATGGANANPLLGMATFTGSRELTTLLLDRGADVAGANVHGWTALHQTAYADQPELATLLLAHGAPAGAEARGAGGTPLVVALFWGNRAAAGVLFEAAGPLPGALRVVAATATLPTAAGTGDMADHGGASGAGAATPVRLADAPSGPREFYRPHSGFPEWTPGDDRQEAVDEALSWAARNDAAAALAPLVELGARVEADVYRGTALGWAAWTGASASIAELLRLGAAVDGRTTFGGPDHARDATPLMLAAQNGGIATVDALLAAGADRRLRDGLHGGTAADWADVCGNAEIAAHLRG